MKLTEIKKMPEKLDARLRGKKPYRVLRGMKVGDVSDPFESKDQAGNDIYKIVKLRELIPVHRANLEQDYMVIHDEALERRQREVFAAWVQRRIASTYIRLTPEVQRCTFERSWIKP